VRSSGHAMVYTLDRQENTSKLGVISSSETEGVPSPFSDPDCSVVISAETGLKYKADGHAVRSANQAEITNGIETKHSIWINAGEKGARTMIDVTGDRLSRIEWGNKGGSVVRARVVEKSGGMPRLNLSSTSTDYKL
jgi:syntaxin-binding protein 5